MDEVVQKVKITQSDPRIASEDFLKYLRESDRTGINRIEVEVGNAEVKSALLEIAAKEGLGEKITVKTAENEAGKISPPHYTTQEL
jgi:hypothetical protein